MKLLYVTANFPYGPTEAFLGSEIRHLQERGHQVLVVPMRGGGKVVHQDARAFLPETLTQPPFSLEIAFSALRVGLARLMPVLRCSAWAVAAARPRLIAKNLAVLPKALWLAEIAKSWGAEHLHVHWAATSATMALFASHISGLSFSITAHRWDIDENNLLSLKGSRASFVRAISREGSSKLIARGVPSEKVHVLHMGVDIRPHAGADVSGHQHEPTFRAVVPANLVPVKGHLILLQSLATLAERNVTFKIDFAGDGPLRKGLVGQAATLGLMDSVSFLGVVSHAWLLEELGAGRWGALILPSIVTPAGEKEGIPVSLMEAMALGVPVISTRSGGIPELLDEGCGMLVPPEQPLALAAAIHELATRSELRERLAAAGRERVDRYFNAAKVTQDLEQNFMKALKKRASSLP